MVVDLVGYGAEGGGFLGEGGQEVGVLSAVKFGLVWLGGLGTGVRQRKGWEGRWDLRGRV